MNLRATTCGKSLYPIVGAALCILVGLLLWKSQPGTRLANYSYDGLWIFGTREITNEVTFVMMDTESFETLHQGRGDIWDRGLHARLLNKLADDGCAAVVMDVFFGQRRDPKTDEAAGRAMKRHQKIALRSGADIKTNSVRPLLPQQPFLTAVSNHWGISHFELDSDDIVRRHWPCPSPGMYPTLAETAARVVGGKISHSRERWLRYYGERPAWKRLNYVQALQHPANFFHNQIVFVGIQPKTLAPENLAHKYQTPYSHWTGECYAGTEMLITEFLNLLNNESLRRSVRLELFTLIIAGIVIGATLARLRFGRACIVALGFGGVVVLGAVVLTATTNYWFPFLLVIVGQVPVGLVCSFCSSRIDKSEQPSSRALKIPGYRLEASFGHGAYGDVWLARKSKRIWRAVKIVSVDKFEDNRAPYDREYEGVSRYRAICDQHPGLMQVEFVSEKFATHFYYVMELGDSLEQGWEKSPANYKPRDLSSIRSLAPQKRLPIAECLRIGLALSDALDLLHRSGLTHRDIKPQNILFVNGQPKLADIGLISHIRPIAEERTAVGTPGYMPPAPEMPGTPAADIYALGMVLYVISTGNSPSMFPELSSTFLADSDPSAFFLLNSIVLKACQPDPKERYASAREMYSALEQLTPKITVTA